MIAPVSLGAIMGPLLLTWITLNHIHYEAWGEIAYSFPNFNGCTDEVWESQSNSIPQFTEHVIT